MFVLNQNINIFKAIDTSSDEKKLFAMSRGVGAKRAPGDEKKELMESCQKFEAVFINLLLKEMKKSVKKTGLFGEDKFAGDVFSSMLDTKIAQ